jgi:PBSX family phage terminase large subunit
MEINLSEWQDSVLFDDHRYKVLNIGRRGGKSTIAAVKMLQFASDYKEKKQGNVWYIAPNYKQAKTIMWQMLMDITPKHRIISKNEVDLSLTLDTGVQISLKGAQDPDTLRGNRIDLCIFDECAFMDKWDTVWHVIRPTLIDSKAEAWFISTPNGFNHFHDIYSLKDVEEKDKDLWRTYHYTTYDNPYLDKEEIDQSKRQMTEDAFAQEYMGEFRKMSGLIYKEFNRDIHMVDIPDLTSYTFTRALDFGFAHKTALIYFAISPTGDRMYAYDGLYESGFTIPQIGEAVMIKDAGKIITNPVADSAQPASIEELNRMGVNFMGVDKEKDSVKNGIVRVAELLRIRNDTGLPTLMFNKSLGWIADEFERYRWVENKSADDSIKEVPYKVNDDAMDCIRYFAMHFQKQQQNVPKYNPRKWSI